MKKKGHVVSLDNLDWTILRSLQKNSRQTYTEIGRRLNLAHSTVYDRIGKMEKRGVIRKYSVAIDPKRAGMKVLTAILTVFTDPRESETVAEGLAKRREVLEVHTSLSEELCVIAKIAAEDQEKLHAFIAQFVAPIPGVLRIRTSIITKTHKEEGLAI